MNTLDEIALKHGTDKATKHPLVIPAHCYTPHYEKFFEPIRNEPLKFLEVGTGGGESMRAWLEYFPNAHVWGTDVVHDTNPYNTPGSKEIDRYTFVHGDQSCPTFWSCFIADHGGDWDVCIDDGSHRSEHIITTFNALWPRIVGGGLYCIEDLACAYSGIFLTPGQPTAMDMIKQKIDSMHQGNSDMSEVHISKELVIIRKK